MRRHTSIVLVISVLILFVSFLSITAMPSKRAATDLSCLELRTNGQRDPLYPDIDFNEVMCPDCNEASGTTVGRGVVVNCTRRDNAENMISACSGSSGSSRGRRNRSTSSSSRETEASSDNPLTSASANCSGNCDDRSCRAENIDQNLFMRHLSIPPPADSNASDASESIGDGSDWTCSKCKKTNPATKKRCGRPCMGWPEGRRTFKEGVHPMKKKADADLAARLSAALEAEPRGKRPSSLRTWKAAPGSTATAKKVRISNKKSKRRSKGGMGQKAGGK